MNDAITWTSLAAMLPVLGAGAALWWKLNRQIDDLKSKNAAQFAATAAVIADFKLEVARNYATNSSIREVEERVVQAIERLGDRLDKFLDNRPRARS